MSRDREFWRRHVEAWRASGMTQVQYSRCHRLSKGSLGYWSSTLKGDKPSRSSVVLVGHTEIKEPKAAPPIELVVGRRYLLRLWAGTDREHMLKVLSVLESQL